MQKQSLQEMVLYLLLLDLVTIMNMQKSELDRLVNVEKVFEKKTLDELKPVLAEQARFYVYIQTHYNCTQLKVKVAIDQENSQKTALLHELGNTVQEKKAQVDALKETVEKLEAKASAGRETLQQQKRRRQELSNWYENALKLLQKVFGASVQVEPENSLIKVKFGPLRKDLWITCAIKMDDTTADILSVEVSRGILANCLTFQDISPTVSSPGSG